MIDYRKAPQEIRHFVLFYRDGMGTSSYDLRNLLTREVRWYAYWDRLFGFVVIRTLLTRDGVIAKLRDILPDIQYVVLEVDIKSVQGSLALAGHIQREVIDEFYE